jgi:hypothetical protein
MLEFIGSIEILEALGHTDAAFVPGRIVVPTKHTTANGAVQVTIGGTEELKPAADCDYDTN